MGNESFLEIEKKFNLSNKDYNIIKSKLILVKKELINDIYMDTCDFKLILNRIKFRLRNGKKELKIKIWNISSEEYYDNESITKLKEIWYDHKKLKKIFTVRTNREKYEGECLWNKYIIDIDKHQYWERYEIEVVCENEIIWNNIIDTIIKELDLDWEESNPLENKSILHIKNQNIELYEKILLQKRYIK